MPALNFTFQESSPLISYSPGWIAVYDHNDPFKSSYNGIFRPTTTNGATATISFLGTGISIFGAIRDNHGNYSVSLDDGPPFIGSGFSDPFRFNFSLWNALNLSYAPHTAVLTNIPVASNRNFVDIDYISIERQIGGPNDTIFQLELDDTSPTINYIGEWERTIQGTAFNSTLHGTINANAQVIIKFPGCCIEVYGQYANANYTAVLDDQPSMTLTGFDTDLVVSDQQPQTLLYLADNLNEEEEHTLTLTNLDTSGNRPFYFDYAIVRSTHDIASSSSGSSPEINQSSSGTQSSTPAGSPSQSVAPTVIQKGTPTGAIIGGVIGGLLALSLVLFSLYLLIRQQRSRTFSNNARMEPEPFIVPGSRDPAHTSASHGLSAGPPMSQASQTNSYSHAATGSVGTVSMLSSSETGRVGTSGSSPSRKRGSKNSSSGRGTRSNTRVREPRREVDAGIILNESLPVRGANPASQPPAYDI